MALRKIKNQYGILWDQLKKKKKENQILVNPEDQLALTPSGTC